jgi:hypothetical protein
MRQYFSPYLSMGNNPINRIDPNGGTDGEITRNGNISTINGKDYFWDGNQLIPIVAEEFAVVASYTGPEPPSVAVIMAQENTRINQNVEGPPELRKLIGSGIVFYRENGHLFPGEEIGMEPDALATYSIILPYSFKTPHRSNRNWLDRSQAIDDAIEKLQELFHGGSPQYEGEGEGDTIWNVWNQPWPTKQWTQDGLRLETNHVVGPPDTVIVD